MTCLIPIHAIWHPIKTTATTRVIPPFSRNISLLQRNPIIVKTQRTTSRIQSTPISSKSYYTTNTVHHLENTDGHSSKDTNNQSPMLQLSPLSPPPPPPPVNPKKRLGWSMQTDDTIIKLRAQGLSWPKIASIIQRPQSAIADRYHAVLDPDLKTWTPSMFAKLDKMVESGELWPKISATLGKRIVSCRSQWQSLGKGRYRTKGFLRAMRNLTWDVPEIERFWDGWLTYGNMDWEKISRSVNSRSEKECQDSFRALVIKSLQDAPGWVKLEAFNYITESNRIARHRITHGVETEELQPDPSDIEKWTEEEHKNLLEAVEVHGLFSGWPEIRKQVKPNLTNTQVENEYYRLNKVISAKKTEDGDKDFVDNGDDDDDDDYDDRETHHYSGWTKEEFEGLNLIMMKYSTLPIWVEEAAKRGIQSSEHDYELIFGKSKRGRAVVQTLGSKDEPTWNRARVRRLIRLVGQQQQQQKATYEPIDWKWIADHIGPGIDTEMCKVIWNRIPRRTNGKYKASKFWNTDEVGVLEKGLTIYGTRWILIQRHVLPERSTDSIRRKVSNVQEKRNHLIKDHTKKAQELKLTNPDLDVQKFVQMALIDEPVCKLAARFEAALQIFEGRKKTENAEEEQQQNGRRKTENTEEEQRQNCRKKTENTKEERQQNKSTKIKDWTDLSWTANEVDLLERGVLHFGLRWTVIHHSVLPQRSPDSIRRKFNKIYTNNDKLIEATKEEVEDMKKINPDLDVNKYVQETLMNDLRHKQYLQIDKAYKTFNEQQKQIVNYTIDPIQLW